MGFRQHTVSMSHCLLLVLWYRLGFPFVITFLSWGTVWTKLDFFFLNS